jgi:hypothetical protein
MSAFLSRYQRRFAAPVFFICLFLFAGANAQQVAKGTIDRKALVSRHNLTIKNPKLGGPTQVGNDEFAYGFDITGMQTFSDKFSTMSHWGWHNEPLPKGMTVESFIKPQVNTHGRMIGYDLPDPNQPEIVRWLQANVHRLNLARIGLTLTKADGTIATATDFKNPIQNLNLWTGIAESNFMLEGEAVKVITTCDPDKDIIGFKITSTLIQKGKLGLFIEFPYGNTNIFSNGSDFSKPAAHQTQLKLAGNNTATFDRKLDSTTYQVVCKWTGSSNIAKTKEHRYAIQPANSETSVEYVFAFSPTKISGALPAFAEIQLKSSAHWPAFWKSGAAIDLSQSKDPRWFELERRIVLSQYEMAINAGGDYPPQETGLVSNSWYGKFHYEMYWWHAAHYALWDKWPILNKSLHVYSDKLASSMKRAKLHGYEGARWPKCTGPDGREWPSLDHAFLIWQQPHPIFFAELDYRAHPTAQTLKKWDKIVEETANFLASYAYLDTARDEYILGPPLRVVSENNDKIKLDAQNPTFELAYWRFGLQAAQEWRRRLKLAPNPKWDKVLKKLSPLPVKDGLYEQWENMTDMWTKYNYEHPALTGIYGVLPGNGVDLATMENTYQKVQATWTWDKCWGWDFPMVAMNAARLGHPEDAVVMLLHKSPKFGFDEHGMVGGGNPYPYFPSNGGLLYAVGMMTAGWDGDKNVPQPGWPRDGNWVVRWEGLKKAL